MIIMPSGRDGKGVYPLERRGKHANQESHSLTFFHSTKALLKVDLPGASEHVCCLSNFSSETSSGTSISYPCHRLLHHTNMSVTGTASVNLGAPNMANGLPSPPPLIQALPENKSRSYSVHSSFCCWKYQSLAWFPREVHQTSSPSTQLVCAT